MSCAFTFSHLVDAFNNNDNMRPRQAEEIHPRENNTRRASKQAPGEDVAKNEDMFLKLKAFQSKEPGFCTLADSKHLVNEVKKKKY